MSFGLQNQTIHKTPTGRIDSRYLDGNDGSDVRPSWSSNLPDLSNLQVGAAFSVDLAATGVLADPGSPAAELGFNFVAGVGAAAAGFSFSGTTLSNACTLATSGAFRFVAVRNGISVLSGTCSFAIKSAPGVDTVAPTIPTGIAAVPGNTVGTIALSFDAPCDLASASTPASGCASVDVLVNGSLASPPSPIVVLPNALAAPTTLVLGSITNPATPVLSQAGKVLTLVCAGTGIASTASEQVLIADFGTFSGAQRVTARIDLYTSSAGSALAGIIIHETGAIGGKFIAFGLGPLNGTTGLYVIARITAGGSSSQVASQLKDANGQNIVGPVYAQISRAADLKTLTVSYSLDERGGTVITTQTITMASAVHIGVFATSQSAGTEITAQIEEVAITGTPTIQSTLSAAAPVSIQLRATDANNPPNVSQLSTALVGIPKQASQSAVKWNWGHYMGSGAILRLNQTAATVCYPESDHLNGFDLILGYRMQVSWGALDPIGTLNFTGNVAGLTSGVLQTAIAVKSYWTYFAAGVYRQVTVAGDGKTCSWTGALPSGNITTCRPYDFTQVDAVLNRLKTQYNLPKRLILTVVCVDFGNGGIQDFAPTWLKSNSSYGTSTIAGSYGWYIGTQGHAAAALHRVAVNTEWIALHSALGAKYDPEPYFEMIIHIENSIWMNACAAAGDFNLTTMESNQAAWCTAAVQAFPTTNVVYHNIFNDTATSTQRVMQTLLNSRVLPGITDTLQYDYVSVPSNNSGTWGTATWLGQVPTGGTLAAVNYRPLTRLHNDIQPPDLGFYKFVAGHRPPIPLDIVKAINLVYQGSYATWAYVANTNGNGPSSGTDGPSSGIWSNLAPVINDPANALITTGYPPNYQ